MCECGLNVPHEPWESPCSLGKPFDGMQDSGKYEYESYGWEVSPESEAIMERHYGHLNLKQDRIRKYAGKIMLQSLIAQRELIQRHMPSMNNVTLAKARKTLAWLENEIQKFNALS